MEGKHPGTTASAGQRTVPVPFSQRQRSLMPPTEREGSLAEFWLWWPPGKAACSPRPIATVFDSFQLLNVKGCPLEQELEPNAPVSLFCSVSSGCSIPRDPFFPGLTGEAKENETASYAEVSQRVLMAKKEGTFNDLLAARARERETEKDEREFASLFLLASRLPHLSDPGSTRLLSCWVFINLLIFPDHHHHQAEGKEKGKDRRNVCLRPLCVPSLCCV